MRACIARRVAECCKGKDTEEGWITTVIQPSSLFLSCTNEQGCIYLPLSCIKPGMGFFSLQTAWRTQQGSGRFKSPLLPYPTPGKKGKGGDTPHPAKGRPPLGSLLCSTFKWPCARVYS